MEPPAGEALVIGAGVIGLTTGVVLRDAGIDAHIVARKMPAETTSDVAAAIWYPTMAQPADRCLPWAVEGLEDFYDLAGGRATGVFVTEVHEYVSEDHEPPWIGDVRAFRRLDPGELPPNRDAGFSIEVPRMEPPLYLRYLVHRFTSSGGTLLNIAVGDLDTVTGRYAAVVNCTGLGAAELVDDPEVFPIRGQVVLVENPGLPRGIVDEVDADSITYLLPRTHQVVLGGTRQAGNWDTEPDDATTKRILEDCARLEPRLADAEVIRVRVGLRPGRSTVRLDAEPTEAGVLVHNYGHGGSGYTLSWGCAREVLGLVRAR